MRHLNHRHRLGLASGPRKQLVRNLAKCLVNEERILTTVAKAKAVRPFVERLITLGRKGTQHHRRLAFSELPDKRAVTKIFDDLAKRAANRPGGYTRIVHAGQRLGDGSYMAYIEFVDKVAGGETPAETTAPAAAPSAG